MPLRAPGNIAPLAVVILAGGCLAASVIQVSAPSCGVRLALSPGRSVAYVGANLRAMRIVVRNLASGQQFAHVADPTAIVDGEFHCFVANLVSGTYLAEVQAFLDAALIATAGVSISAPFQVTAGSVPSVTLPSMVLAPTPVGDWLVEATVTESFGWKVTGFVFSLALADGRTASRPSSGLNTVRWGQVSAFPQEVATTTVSVRGQKGNIARIKLLLSTVAITPGATVTTAVATTFP